MLLSGPGFRLVGRERERGPGSGAGWTTTLFFGVDSFGEEELKAEMEAKSAASSSAAKSAVGKTSAVGKPVRPRARKPAKPKA